MMFEDKIGKKIIIEFEGELICISDKPEYAELNDYKENLNVKDGFDDKFNIIKVWSAPKCKGYLLSTSTKHRKLLFKRTEKKSLTISELCQLAGVDFDSVNII